ncbi:unnamed protein product, partial [Mesorhabditis spiculigera]
MKIAWESENWPGAKIDPGITCLAWMHQPDLPGQGMLGIGNESGAVGITLTSEKPIKDDQQRYNFNLRGHHSTICMTAWNKPQCKLASCDSSGVIYVWVRNDDRWSVELVNDRGVKVRDLAWSPCGQSALICYEDNFVLVGSASGQRIWSHQFPQDDPNMQVNCGVWAAESREIILGFASGMFQVMFCDGGNITERRISDSPIEEMACSTERDGKWTLALLTEDGHLKMISAYDQVVPHSYECKERIRRIQWNTAGTQLAAISHKDEVLVFNVDAQLIHRERVPVPKGKELTAFTWVNEGKALMFAAGGHVAVGKLMEGDVIPTLFNLVKYALWQDLDATGRKVDSLKLPGWAKREIADHDHHVVRCRIPRPDDLCQFICTVHEARSYCTIRPLSRGSPSYVLCMEHMGGLVPLLVGRQVNRFLPQFYISLHHEATAGATTTTRQAHTTGRQIPIGSSAQVEDMSLISRSTTGRNSLWRKSKRQLRALMTRHVNAAVRPARVDTRLVHVTSNVWCTRFQVTSMAPRLLPPYLAQIIYKTSVLHLQPRQMTVELCNMGKKHRMQARTGAAAAAPQPEPSMHHDAEDEALLNEADDSDLTNLLYGAQIGSQNDTERDDGLTLEEQRFFDKVLTECASLRAAMEMAVPSTSSDYVNSKKSEGTTTHASTSFSEVASPSLSHAEIGSLATSAISWQEEVDSMEFIDGVDEETALLTARKKGLKKSEQPGTSKASKEALKKGAELMKRRKEIKKDQEEIRQLLDKLSRIAEQIGKRQLDFKKNRDRDSIRKMRSQVKELLRRVNEIEMKVDGADLRGEVKQLIQTIEEMKRALGEGARGKETHKLAADLLTLHNKAPIWNETNQVYQLDFGGRVTQESAKNFQIEVNSKQVLQFGRIEGGAYTLDFRAPFCGAQAFAVALASITQRLK